MALYIIPTPIGNLGDLTFRAKQTLASLDIILAEDPRRTIRLLNHYQVAGPDLTAFNDHNHQRKIPQIINWLKETKKIGLVSNAGTPVISDPGYRLVKAAIKENIPIIPLPGPTALITGLTASGFPPTRFSFLGFIPKGKKKKSKIFNQLVESKDLIPTIVFYESPKRLVSTLEVIQEELGNIPIVICREMTKKYEEFLRGNLDLVIDQLKKRSEIKGEVTVVIKLD